MLEKMTFTNHINESIEFGANGIFVNYNDLRDYEWDYATVNNKISAFSKGIVSKAIPVIIICSSEPDGIEVKNRLFEVAEKDVLALSHGKLTIGDYNLKCYIIGSKKDNYLKNKGYLETTLTVITDYPSWTKESSHAFRIVESGTGKNLDYAYDYPYDYTSESKNKTLNNTGFVGSDFKMIVYGPCVNPSVYIAGHEYSVICDVSDSEYLTIDSLAKKIILKKYNGIEENKFNGRNRESYIFEKIPAGDNVVTWDNSFEFDIVIYEERSEPKWT